MIAQEQIEKLKVENAELRRMLAEEHTAWRRREEFHDKQIARLKREINEMIASESMRSILETGDRIDRGFSSYGGI